MALMRQVVLTWADAWVIPMGEVEGPAPGAPAAEDTSIAKVEGGHFLECLHPRWVVFRQSWEGYRLEGSWEGRAVGRSLAKEGRGGTRGEVGLRNSVGREASCLEGETGLETSAASHPGRGDRITHVDRCTWLTRTR
jgi:hypothetical protein